MDHTYIAIWQKMNGQRKCVNLIVKLEYDLVTKWKFCFVRTQINLKKIYFRWKYHALNTPTSSFHSYTKFLEGNVKEISKVMCSGSWERWGLGWRWMCIRDKQGFQDMVSGIYWENCAFLSTFSILWRIGFWSMN